MFFVFQPPALPLQSPNWAILVWHCLLGQLSLSAGNKIYAAGPYRTWCVFFVRRPLLRILWACQGRLQKEGGLQVFCHTGSRDEFWCTRSILKPSELAHFVLSSSMAARDRRHEGSEADDSGDHSVIFYASALFLLSTLQRQRFYGFGVKKKHPLNTLRKKSLFVT